MPAAKYVKTAAEKKRYQIDYTDWLDTNELVTSVAFTITPVTAPALVVDGVQVQLGSLGVQYYISGGVNGKDYAIAATLTTNNGPQVRQDEILVSVRAL